MNRYFVIAAAALLTGCGDKPFEPLLHVPCNPFLHAFGEVAGDTVTTAEGLRYIVIQPGSGEAAAPPRTVDVNYSGYLESGARFDSSCPGSRLLLRVTLGSPDVIPGFDLAMWGMQPGEIRRAIVPPILGYGGTPPTGSIIPPNATLIFDIELVRFPRRQ